jgi:hypothetical protein
MSEYPDANKLAFFSCDSDDESIDFSYSDEDEAMYIIRKSLKEILDEEQISICHQALILNTLTWSVQDRFTIPQVRTIRYFKSMSCIEYLLYIDYCKTR